MATSVELCNKKFEDFVYHSLLYYSLDTSEISDTLFDLLAVDLSELWDNVTHPDKGLITREDLQLRSGFSLVDHWPSWAIKRAIDAGHDHCYLDQYRQTESVT